MSITKETEITVYVTDLKRAIQFYENLFEVKIEEIYKDRWANIPKSMLFLLSMDYDIREAIPKTSHQEKLVHGNSCIPVFQTQDIEKEHSRVMAFSDDVSEICFLNLVTPYYFFTFMDPDRNILEIGYYPPVND